MSVAAFVPAFAQESESTGGGAPMQLIAPPPTGQPAPTEPAPQPASQPQPATPPQPASQPRPVTQPQPVTPPQPATQPQPVTSPQPAHPPTATPAPAPRSIPEVEVNELARLDPDSIGLLDEERGGFRLDMWAGSSRELIERLLPRLPAAIESRSVRALARRLLLSIARSPAGEGHENLLALRAERLAAMGEYAAVTKFLGAMPAKMNGQLARLRLDGSLLAGDQAAACDEARKAARESPNPYAYKVLIFCQAAAGDRAGAQLGLALLDEQGTDDDPAFPALVALVLGEPGVKVPPVTKPSPLEVAMIRAARQPVPTGTVADAEPAVLAAIARASGVELDERLEAAERAEKFGALEASEVAELYAAVRFDVESLAKPLGRAKQSYGPRARALLYQSVRQGGDPAARARLLGDSLRLAGTSEAYGTTMRVMLPLLAEIKPSSDLVPWSGELARSLYVALRVEEASRWAEIAEARAVASGGTSKVALRLWPIRWLAGGATAPGQDEARARLWLEDALAGKDDGARRASLFLNLLTAFDVSVDATLWARVLDGAPEEEAPEPALWYGLHAAAGAKRVGETVLLALVTLGDTPLGAANPRVLGAVVSSLRRVGLSEEARALALEAAIYGGL